MIGVVRTSETSVYFYKTKRRNISAGYYLHARRRENLKFDKFLPNNGNHADIYTYTAASISQLYSGDLL
jgi:hypothetical protein